MTHEELLAKMANIAHTKDANEARNDYLLALRAVVELHKPIYDNSCYDPDCCGGPYPDRCENCIEDYPCPTIQAIEKELG